MKLLILLSLFISSTSFASGKYLFNANFSMSHKGSTYKYNLDFYEGLKGLVVKSKMNGLEQTHYIQTEGKQYIIARTPKDLIDKPLFYMYRINSQKYKIQYPVNMNNSNWDKFLFSVEDGEARSHEVPFQGLKVGRTIFDTCWGMRVPVGVESIDIK